MFLNTFFLTFPSQSTSWILNPNPGHQIIFSIFNLLALSDVCALMSACRPIVTLTLLTLLLAEEKETKRREEEKRQMNRKQMEQGICVGYTI